MWQFLPNVTSDKLEQLWPTVTSDKLEQLWPTVTIETDCDYCYHILQEWPLLMTAYHKC